MATLNTNIQQQIQHLETAHRLRQTTTTTPLAGTKVKRNGKPLISFSSNDYLGLSQHQQVKQAAMEAIERYGTGAGASRMITGNNPLYDKLESHLCQLKNSEAAIVFGSGYLANMGVISALMGKGDLIIADKLSHASLINGAQLSGATFQRFSHNDVTACEKWLQKYRHHHRHCLLVTETVFSMDGDRAPVDALYALAQRYDAWLLVDDAHGLGVVTNDYQCTPHIIMGTLSKAVGSYGGYMCASTSVANYVRNRAKSLIFSTALPPATLAAADAALGIIQSDHVLTQTPLRLARDFTTQIHLPEAESAIVPVILGSDAQALTASHLLEQHGFLVCPIRPPAVPNGTARLRITFSALHTPQDIGTLANIIHTELLCQTP